MNNVINYLQEEISNILTNDVPNWTTLVVEAIIGVLLFWIGLRDNRQYQMNQQRYQENQDYLRKKDLEMNQRFESQIEYTIKLSESIKSKLSDKEKAVFKESMSAFLFLKFHEYLTKFVNLWEQYKKNEMKRIGHRMEDEIDIIAQNMEDLIAKSELEITTGDLEPLKNLADGYDNFAHRRASIGDRDVFNREGEELYQKTIQLKEIVKEKIQNS